MNGDLASIQEIQNTLYEKIFDRVEMEQQSAEDMIYIPDNERD